MQLALLLAFLRLNPGQKKDKSLHVGELNPGLPRDRRGYYPLNHQCAPHEKEVVLNLLCRRALVFRQGELAQMVERSLSMREVAGIDARILQWLGLCEDSFS